MEFPIKANEVGAVSYLATCLFLLFFQTVRVAVFYSNPQRLDVYVNNRLVAPTNAQWNKDKTDYTLLKPAYTGTVELKSDLIKSAIVSQ